MSRAPRPDPWERLRAFTAARIALGRAGHGLPTAELLRFGLAHAQARDAVHVPLDADALVRDLAAEGQPAVVVHSRAADRASYLRRPDLGRMLDDDSRQRIAAMRPEVPPDVVLVVADGLSSRAAGCHAVPLIRALRPLLADWRFGPTVVARQARVALGDEIGALLAARQVVVLIGERPGLSSPDSLGLYLTHDPRPGRTDAERNCISNVRPEGLPADAAAARLAWLMGAAQRLGATGVRLKDDSRAGSALSGGTGA